MSAHKELDQEPRPGPRPETPFPIMGVTAVGVVTGDARGVAARGGWCARAAMVTQVELAADAYLSCLTHALTTEREEVMGLLLGEVRNILHLIWNDNDFDPSHIEQYKNIQNV